MIIFFRNKFETVYVLEATVRLTKSEMDKLIWLFHGAKHIPKDYLDGDYIGPRKEMVSPWSTNAVEITQNMLIRGISRIEEFIPAFKVTNDFDPMLQALYNGIGQDVFTVLKKPESIEFITDIAAYNQKEGLALSEEEINYLLEVSRQIGRRLTDSEIYGFAQINSEHCRHKIFNGLFVVDGREMPESLFSLIKKTSKLNPNRIVSAYKDNVAFIRGPKAEQFAPKRQDKADFFSIKEIETIISLKAETHNFPTTVEPFNGAATGSGGEIRDRMAGGKGSLPLAGTAVYITSYPRLEGGRPWEKKFQERKWLYHSPSSILVKASNGASDFGNKFGQPLINGSLLTFEHFEGKEKYAYDKVVMLAGGIGFAKAEDAAKEIPQKGDRIIVMGGDNYRIGMGGGAVSSVATGEFNNSIELNAVQRSNPEMQKRVANALRAMVESDKNPVISVHDHGAGGHLNSISELVEASGGYVDMTKLPVGDPTLSAREIIGNESQERMGLVIAEKDAELLRKISERERAPIYFAGEVTGDQHLCFDFGKKGKPVDLNLAFLFGKPPKTVLSDTSLGKIYQKETYDPAMLEKYLEMVLQLESVACKDWLTNKVDRSVTGRIAMQQCVGEIQLPLSNLGITALDYRGIRGIATAIGHAPAAGLISPESGSVLSITEALTNIVWAPIEGALSGVSLSANWMWPCKNPGEDARLYRAVKAASDFAIGLEINIPTGKDSLSMTQKYPDGEKVLSPGTVIISAVGEVKDIRKAVTPALLPDTGSTLLYIDFSKSDFALGGSALAQVLNVLGFETPAVKDTAYFKNCFNAIQELIDQKLILAGHDVSAGGLITTLLEMTFSSTRIGLEVDLNTLNEKDPIKALFSERPGVVVQVKKLKNVEKLLLKKGVNYYSIGKVTFNGELNLSLGAANYKWEITKVRDIWYKTSFFFDKIQSGEQNAIERYRNYKYQKLEFKFTKTFTGQPSQYGINPSGKKSTGPKAAIIREKGVNGDREMAYSMFYAGFDVKDIHMTDLATGREDLSDVNFIVFVGGFSNSDVLGSAKGWAGAFLYNEKAKYALDRFYQREDTLSLGICNGCQLMIELGLINPLHEEKPRLYHNVSGKFESAFLNVDIQKNHSVMLGSLAGSRLGIWVAHGEGRFELPYPEEHYHIPVKYSYSAYPGNPNGSVFNTAGICSDDGRHLAMMPHLERAVFPWQWAYYPLSRKKDELTPWMEAFVNARKWVEQKTRNI